MSTLKDVFVAILVTIRAGLPKAFILFAIFLICSMFLAAEFSARHPATVALDTGLSLLRIGLPLIMLFTLHELITREIERRVFLTSFAYPRSRTQWFISRIFAAYLMVCIQIAVLGLLMAVAVIWIGAGYQQGTPLDLGKAYLITLSLIGLDFFVLLAIAGLFSVISTSSMFVILGTIGFTLIARSYMPIIKLIQDNDYLVEKIADPQLYQSSMHMLIYVLPDLGSLDVRMISLYGEMEFLPHNIWLLIAISIAYSVAIIGLATWYLNKREYA